MDTLSPAAANYAAMTFEELAALKKVLDAAYVLKKTEAQAAFFERIAREAQEMGFDLPKGTPGKAPRKAKGGSQAPVRYRDPSNPENTWSGRGKPAKWLKELIDQGKDKEDYRVRS